MLCESGFNVQLKHEQTETSWEEHGWVKVLDSEGNVLASCTNMQHNRQFRNRPVLAAEMMKAMPDASALKKAAAAS